MLRWVGRIAGTFFALAAIIGIFIAAHYHFNLQDPGRERVNETIAATGQLRFLLRRDAHIKVRELEDDGTDDNLELIVSYSASTPQAERKDLYASTNIIVRRQMPHVREVKVVFGEEPSPVAPFFGAAGAGLLPGPAGEGDGGAAALGDGDGEAVGAGAGS